MKMNIRVFVGCDLGDRFSALCVLDAAGIVQKREHIRTSEPALRKMFGEMKRARVVLETGTHSPWVSRLLAELGHEVVVANARELHLIFRSKSKSDTTDAEALARLGRTDPRLLRPIEHRGFEAQRDLMVIRARDVAVKARTKLVNAVRGLSKSFGDRIAVCSAEAFPKRAREMLKKEILGGVEPLLMAIEGLSANIKAYDNKIEALCEEYPETVVLRQIAGVGPISALAFVLTIDDPERFKKSRLVAAFLGLTPRLDQSGDSNKQLRITKAGSPLLRSLLVNCAHYILGRFGPDSDLKRWGLKLAERGGKNAKKRAVVATARKLAVLMHRLWITGELYAPIGYRKDSSKAA